MSPRKALTSLAALALVSTAVLSAPAVAQTNQNDDTLWLLGWGAAGAAILALILSSNPHVAENPPISP
jgi:malic enzyme